MPIYNFDNKQSYVTIDKVPDFRSDEEKLNSLLSIYNHGNPDIAYAERLAEEIINISGAWVTVYPRAINSGNRDDIWDEDADPKFHRGVKLKGYFAPKPVAAQMTKWGIDAPNQTSVWFSRANIYKLFGNRMVTEGDIIILPHNTMSVIQDDNRDGLGTKMDRFRVISASDQGNFKFRWIYWVCACENITGDPTVDVEFVKNNS